MRRIVMFRITPELLQESLHFPVNIHIVDIQGRMTYAERDEYKIWVEGEDFPEVPENGVIPEVSPTITYTMESYTWDWRLPKKEGQE